MWPWSNPDGLNIVRRLGPYVSVDVPDHRLFHNKGMFNLILFKFCF